MKKELSPSQKLSTGRLMARERLPYFGAMLHALTPVEIPEGALDTFGVLPNSVLLVDNAALRRWTIEETAAVLVHEGLHIVRDHDKRRKAIGANTYGESRVWNLAADVEINDDLKDAGLTLPENAIYPKTFGMEPGLTAEIYYGELMKMAQTCPICGGNPNDGDRDGDGNGCGCDGSCGEDGCSCGDGGDAEDGQKDGKKGKGKGKKSKGKKGKGKKGDGKQGGRQGGRCPFCDGPQKPGAGSGWCGSGGGRPVPGEPDMKSKSEQAGRSEVELKSLRRQVAEQVREASEKSRGTVPAGLVRWAEAELAPPRIDWRTKLSQVARTAVGFRPGAVDFRYNRPSRRQSALGYGMGCPVLPALIRPVPQVAIAVDTSGSMSAEDLRIAVEESDGILKAIGAEVTFIACDAAVGAVKPVRSARELAESLVGGGGTDFAPVFETVERLRPRPEVIVYATDGCGPAPLAAPAGVRVIWLLVGQYRQRPHFPAGEWGEFIDVDDLYDDEAA